MLVGSLIDMYAQWYICGNLTTVMRLAHAFAEMDGTPSVMHTFARNAQMRRLLCEVTILTLNQPRRSSNELWRIKNAVDTLPVMPSEKDCVHDGVNAVRRLVSDGDGRGVVMLTAALLNDPAGRGKDVPPPPKDVPVKRPHDRDVAWHLWCVATEVASTQPETVQQFVQASLRLYSQRFTLQRRSVRGNLLCYALLTCTRGRVASLSPLEAHVEARIEAGCNMIGGVFDDIIGCDVQSTPIVCDDRNEAVAAEEADEDEPGDGEDEYARVCTGTKADCVSNSSEGDIDYLMCYTHFDNELRCRIADERRDGGAACPGFSHIKRIMVVPKLKKTLKDKTITLSERKIQNALLAGR